MFTVRRLAPKCAFALFNFDPNGVLVRDISARTLVGNSHFTLSLSSVFAAVAFGITAGHGI